MLLPLFLASSITIGSGLPIVSLPGLPEMPKWKMDSGYVTYTSPMQKSQHHTFVWIAESQNDPSTDPILFWSNGGPGCSGLFGMGFENGPFQAQSDGGLLPSEYSWNKRATVVWFEQPAGVGFSYSDNPADYNNYNDTVSSTDNAAFLTAFFAAYPKYQSLKLFLTSESCECGGLATLLAISSYLLSYTQHLPGHPLPTPRRLLTQMAETTFPNLLQPC